MMMEGNEYGRSVTLAEIQCLLLSLCSVLCPLAAIVSLLRAAYIVALP